MGGYTPLSLRRYVAASVAEPPLSMPKNDSACPLGCTSARKDKQVRHKNDDKQESAVTKLATPLIWGQTTRLGQPYTPKQTECLSMGPRPENTKKKSKRRRNKTNSEAAISSQHHQQRSSARPMVASISSGATSTLRKQHNGADQTVWAERATPFTTCDICDVFDNHPYGWPSVGQQSHTTVVTVVPRWKILD